MNAERRQQLEQRYDAAAWRGRNAHPGGLVRGFTVTGQEITGWQPQRVDRKLGPPPHTVSLWRRLVDSPDEVLRVDVFELPTVDAAHDYLIDLLDEFQATEIRRREPAPVGDVAFGTSMVLLFARGNLVVLARNAGRAVVEVAGPARDLDVRLANLLTRGQPGS